MLDSRVARSRQTMTHETTFALSNVRIVDEVKTIKKVIRLLMQMQRYSCWDWPAEMYSSAFDPNSAPDSQMRELPMIKSMIVYLTDRSQCRHVMPGRRSQSSSTGCDDDMTQRTPGAPPAAPKTVEEDDEREMLPFVCQLDGGKFRTYSKRRSSFTQKVEVCVSCMPTHRQLCSFPTHLSKGRWCV